MILASRGGNVHLRSQMFGGVDVIPMPSQEGGSWSSAGRRVTPQNAMGLPAVLRGLRVISETVGTLPLIVYRETATGRERARDAGQWSLLHDKPNDIQTPFGFKAFLLASLVGHGNAYALKAKARGSVRALYPLSPTRVECKSDGQTVTYIVRDKDGRRELTRDDILHIPGLLLDDPYVGVSPIVANSNAIGTGLAAEDFAGRFYDNDATPGGVLEMPAGANTQVAKDTKEVWDAGGRGSRHAHQTRVLFGGATYKQVGVDAQSAQIIETQNWTVDQAARVIGLPSWAIGGTDANPRATPEQHNQELLQFGIAPHLVRVEEGFHADDDLFPDKSVFPEFLAEGLLRADLSMRYEAYLKARQAGWLSVNDIRAKENEPPIEGGDDYQSTPVGGAPNLQPGQGDNQDEGQKDA